jgi:hypothetical protein
LSTLRSTPFSSEFNPLKKATLLLEKATVTVTGSWLHQTASQQGGHGPIVRCSHTCSYSTHPQNQSAANNINTDVQKKHCDMQLEQDLKFEWKL